MSEENFQMCACADNQGNIHFASTIKEAKAKAAAANRECDCFTKK